MSAPEESVGARKPSWGDDVLSSTAGQSDGGETYTGWLNGLIKPEPEALPPRDQESGHFAPDGAWVVGSGDADDNGADLTLGVDTETMREIYRRIRKKKNELPTGEVPLEQMLSKATQVEQEKPRSESPAPPLRLPQTRPPEPSSPASASLDQAASPTPAARPAWAKPETLVEPDSAPAPAWVAKLAQPAAAPSVAASPPTKRKGEDDLILTRAPVSSSRTSPPKSSSSGPSRVDRVATSVPKRSFMQTWSAAAQRERVSFYRALTTMLAAGLPLFGVFDFLASQAESSEQREACRRIAGDLVAGYPLHKAAYKEPALFSEMAVKLLEIGMRSGKLVAVLQRLSADEEHRWRMRQTLQSHLMYPVCIASLSLVAVVILPPFVLGDLLSQVVKMTAEPPFLTKAILAFSTSLSSPAFLIFLAVTAAAIALAARSHKVRETLVKMEPLLWEVPGLGELIRSAVSLRFLRVFSMTYDVGLAAPQCLLLASEATGSRKAIVAGPRMKGLLIEGGSLKECLEIGDFLPSLVVESMEAAQQSGDVSGMMESVAKIVESELEYRIETLMALIEPLFMALLGVFVGVFAIGCLLPILKLSESL